MKCSSLLLAVASCVLVVLVNGYSTGAPTESCLDLIPQHPGGSTQSNKGGFEIISDLFYSNGTYIPDRSYQIALADSSQSFGFTGFILQAVNALATEPTPIGTFSVDPLEHDYMYLMNCSTEYPFATLTQTSKFLKSFLVFNWTAPPEPGTVDFRYTIVTSYNETAFGPFSLFDKEYLVLSNSASVHPTSMPNLIPPLACPPFSSGNITTSSFQIHLGVTGGRNYYFIATENTYDRRFVDIQLGAIAQAWVAIGFSASSQMAEADVLACVLDSTSGNIIVVDAWNPLPNHSPAIVDNTQNGVCLHEANFTDGTLSCSFSRYIDVIDVGQDVDLYSRLYQMYASGDHTVSSRSNRQGQTDFGEFIAQHEDIPDISYLAISIANATTTFVLPSKELTRIHGVLMIFAWTMVALWAIFLSTWLKVALPRGEWLEFHQTFMLAATILSACGMFAIFSANYNNYTVSPGLISFSCGRSTAHFILGIIVTLLQITNLLIPVFRCNPDSSRRWVFTLMHGNVLGLSTVFLALTNVGLGMILYEVKCRDLDAFTRSPIFWVYIGFIVFQAVIQGAMIIVFTVSALKQKDRTEQLKRAPLFIKFFIMMLKSKNASDEQELIEMRELSESRKPPKKQLIKVASVASEDSLLRWACFFVFIPVTVITPLVLAILIVTAPMVTEN